MQIIQNNADQVFEGTEQDPAPYHSQDPDKVLSCWARIATKRRAKAAFILFWYASVMQ